MALRLVPKPPPLEEDPRDLLRACHGRIRSFLALAAKAVEGPVDALHVDAAREAGRFFGIALPLHAEDEDLSVAPRLLALDDAELAATLDSMTAEHPPIERLGHEIARGCEEMVRVRAVPAKLADAIAELAGLLEPHLAREERLVFPALDRLSAEARREIASEARERRRIAYATPGSTGPGLTGPTGPGFTGVKTS